MIFRHFSTSSTTIGNLIRKNFVMGLMNNNNQTYTITSKSIPATFGSLKMSSSSSSLTNKPMFRFQNSLPKLPVPSLEETCSTYLQSVKPHLTATEFERTKKSVAEFLKPGGMGEELQKRLLARDSQVTTSWLIDWWNDYAYMAYRDPVVVYVSYFFVFKDDPFRNDPAVRAASIIQGAMQFRDLLLREELEPDMAKKSPLCMHQYKYMFNSTRIPQIPSDVTKLADPETNNHIIVMRKNQFFSIDLVQKGKRLSTQEIESQIRSVYEMAQDPYVPAIGALTTDNRDQWTVIREKLYGLSAKNKANLDKIERSIFVVCLDDSKPVTREEASVACWHGDGKNRFFDKALQFIVFDNAKAGFNGEHSMMDATPTDRMCNYICEQLAKNGVDHGVSSNQTLAAPERLDFDLDWELKDAIQLAEARFKELTEKHDLQVVNYEGYGKNLIKTLRVSPDAYAQMAIQLAYYKMYGKFVPTYESAQTKKFAYGRTETCRSCTIESVEWVKAMQDPTFDVKTKGELGRRAIASQSAYMAKAVEGKGCDRHLLGLKFLIRPEEPVPSIFTDPTYAKTCRWQLSTSQISSEYYDGYGWGEVVPDGYGVAYMVKNNSLQFNLVSLNLNNHHFRHYFHEALNEMKVVFEATVPAPPPSSKL